LGSLEEYVMTYAIIRSGGKQFRVEKGATVRVPSIEKDAGEGIEGAAKDVDASGAAIT
jgi:hypothetical protein